MSPVITPTHADLDRRSALKFLASGLVLTLTSCRKPQEEIVPYVDMPERLLPGEPLKFATTMALGGYGRGVLATSVDGRPIKIEGNPRHPASLGATDVFAEAEILSLYDPGRSKAPRHGDDIASWNAFAGALRVQMEREQARRGAGLRIVTGRVTSPTLLRQIDDVLKQLPEARWYRYEPVSDDAFLAGAALAFGRPLTALPRLADASVIVTLDADPLGPGPRQIADGRAFAQGRKPDAKPFSRLYAVEPDWSLTGANADHRLAMHPSLIRNIAIALAAALRGEQTPAEMPADAGKFVRAAVADLTANKGHALVLAGLRQPAEVHALCHWINAWLEAPVDWIELVDPNGLTHAETLKTFSGELHQSDIETLLIAGVNPAYDLLSFGVDDALRRVPFTAHLGLHDDETAALCQWHLPLSHALESWSDLRAFDGAASIVQPLIRPLYDTRTMHDVVAMAAGQLSPSPYDMVRQTWATQASGDFDYWWRRALHDGVIANSAAPPVAVNAPNLPDVAPAKAAGGVTLVFAPDAAIWDGHYANNAWLQECPRPLTKEVWGNSIAIAPATAARLGVGDGDVVEVTQDRRVLRGPVRICDGMANDVMAAALGYGRTHAGAIGNGIGFAVNALRSAQSPWLVDGVGVKPTGARTFVASTQHQFKLEGESKDLLPILTVVELAQGKTPADHDDESKPTLLPPVKTDTYAWAMVIDTTACIGCNACVVACQAENNVPVVGPAEIARGRDMHWLRIDSYVEDAQQPGFQPVPCMHCEHAPCEPVCPVAASVHDGEGLNVQVYNRCIGTRFCQANCPYKVRRFNYFGYADGQEYGDLGAEVVTAAHNPDVSVRARGVMEKCTYCVQRISRARRIAEKEDRTIADGDIVTACQAACPTQAIHFGDHSDKASRVNALRGEPHHYALLGHLGARPRTTYLARLRNPSPALQEPQT
jgi:molybdopterin-containing oxidoreductase family iron-sulfur binding subunit